MALFTPDTQARRQLRLLLGYTQRLRRRRWRALAWLQGDADECHQQAQALWHAREWQAPLWVSATKPDALTANDWLRAGQARSRLGGEHELVVFDAVSEGSGLDPDALGALAGTLTVGGLLVIMTPSAWGRAPDAEYARFADYPYHASALSSHYLERFARLLKTSDQIVRWRPGQTLELPRLARRESGQDESPADPACISMDQAAAVERTTRLRRRRPLVITADRGRGKSAALGIGCARLLQKGVSRIVVTAPSTGAVEALFQRLEALCPEGRRQGTDFCLAGDTPKVVSFILPSILAQEVEAGREGGEGSYLLVDEAAAIAPALLGQWLVAFPRIVFATTVHGYEGSGRGFALRFRQRLQQQTPEWRELVMRTPIRWAPGDPLEQVIGKVLVLDAEPEAIMEEPLTRVCLERAALARDEPRLRRVFGLLVQAHYRTTPSDLRQLLDGPTTRLQVLESESRPQAVLVTGEEGGFGAELAESVAQGKRRPQGHLLAQSLAAHAGSRQAARLRWRRVMRIAVHAERRRQGLGKRLLETDIADARLDGVDLYGATFGAEPGLIAFWRAMGFKVVRLGLSHDITTGEHAVMVARPLSPAGEELVAYLQHRFLLTLPGLLAFELTRLAPDVVAALLADMPPPTLDTIATLQDLHDVAHAHREPSLARPALQALGIHGCRQGVTEDNVQALEALVGWAFQGRALSRERRAALKPLRRAVALLLADETLFPTGAHR
ncbi:GNAT family N-acetyltransferase [Halomonas sp. Bachu 37]|uniref:tRNA(Met) cytidine acetyltransferase TmcA n=1 Tax=Halomonas kashgarensis TaxID=3084920 RepID=UPI00321649ED